MKLDYCCVNMEQMMSNGKYRFINLGLYTKDNMRIKFCPNCGESVNVERNQTYEEGTNCCES